MHCGSMSSRKASESVLDDIPGLGNDRKRLLLLHFGSVKVIKKASVAELMGVPGIGEKTAKSILSGLKNA